MILLFLAFDAVAGPRHGFQPLLLDFLLAFHALAVRAFFHTFQSLSHKLQHTAVLVALMEQEFFGVGIGGLIDDVSVT